jgi:monothiol glutaredoxin
MKVSMQRRVLDERRIHPATREKIATYRSAIVDEVESAAAKHDVVVVGMRQNPFPGRARKLLEGRGIHHHYLEYGSYLSQWKPRLALKLWTGWPTFPMIFVRGVLIGGYQDLERAMDNGEFGALLEAPRA